MIKSRILLFICVICLVSSCDKDVINWNSYYLYYWQST